MELGLRYYTKRLNGRIFGLSNWLFRPEQMCLRGIEEERRSAMAQARMTELRFSCDNVSRIIFGSNDFPDYAVLIVTNQDTALLDDSSAAPPAMKGFLNKYTNVAKGYNPRWFVLKDGILSCALCFIIQLPNELKILVQIIDTEKTKISRVEVRSPCPQHRLK